MSFLQKEFTFLGHVIGEGRIEAVLSYPSAENRRQLRQFLDVTNCCHKFVIGYANYPPLLALLKKRIRWGWPPELQKAFEVLRARFSDTIRLTHPNESLPDTINTDASGKAVAAVLK
jgi:hypothetical protein